MMGVGGTVPVSRESRELLSAVEGFGRRPRFGREPEELAAELIHLRHAIDLLELEFSATAAAFAETDGWEEWGSTTPIDWIRHNCQMSGAAAADRFSVGRQLKALPRSVAAVTDGSIGFAHLSVIVRTADAVAASIGDEPFDENLVLDQARQGSVGRLWYFCQRVRHAADPVGVAEEQRDAADRRCLKLSPHEDGSLSLDGWLDPIGGAALRTALEPLARPSGAVDDRCCERRFADALVELATHALDIGAIPQHAGQRPHLQVTTSLDSLRGLKGTPAAELEYSSPIGTRTVQRLACDASITRVLFGPGSIVVDVGRARRVVSAPARKALNARDRFCRWPGCERPASWSDVHHLVHWTQGGGTDLSNLILLCHRHHMMVHEGGWQLVGADDGRMVPIPSTHDFQASARAPDSVSAA